MRIAIVACDHFKGELETLTEGDADFVMREYLEFNLHNDPNKLHDVIVEKVNRLEGTMDAGGSPIGELKVVLGGYAFNSVEGLWSVIGADGFAKDAEEATRVANELLKGWS